MLKNRLVPTVVLLLVASTSQAQVKPDTLKPDARIIRLDSLVVYAAVPFITRGGASALAVRPDSLRLGPTTIERVVRELPFVQVRTNARGEAYFALRGSSFDARETAVLIDGLPVSLGFDHRADLAMLPATGALSLTVVRGIPALLYGPNVLGGVVEIGLTAMQAPSQTFTLNAGYDHTGGYAVSGQSSVSLAARGGRVRMRGGAGYRQTGGFPLPGAVREPAPFTDRDVRLNSDRLQRDGFLSAGYASNGGAWLSVSSFGYSAERGAPAELNATNARFWRYPQLRRVLGSLSAGSGVRSAPWGGTVRIESSLGHDAGRTALRSYEDRSYSTVQDQESSEDRNVTARVLAVQTLGTMGELSGALTYASVRREEVVSGAALTYQQQLYSAAIETGWRFALRGGPRMRLHAGYAYDAANTPKSADKPEVESMDIRGARIGFTGSSTSGRLLVHGGIGRRARFPSLRELYAGALRMFEPNPQLRPEVLIASEVGSTLQLGSASVQAVLFHHRIKDAIVRTTTATRRVKRINRDETRSTGLELLALAPLRSATISLDLTAQTVESSDPTADRDFRAEYQPKFAGGVRVGAPLLLKARLDVSARVTGSQYCLDTSGSYTRLERSQRSDVQLSRAWHVRGAGAFSSLEGGIAVDNVGDAAIFDQCGLPQPGRLLRLRMTLR